MRTDTRTGEAACLAKHAVIPLALAAATTEETLGERVRELAGKVASRSVKVVK